MKPWMLPGPCAKGEGWQKPEWPPEPLYIPGDMSPDYTEAHARIAGPEVAAPRGYMNEATRLSTRVFTLESVIRTACRMLRAGAEPFSEREARVLAMLEEMVL